jgi:hypothetical protein
VPAVLIFAVCGLWGFVLCLKIVTDHLGFIGGVIAFALAPVAFAFAPWYAGIADGNWFPLLLNYGGSISAGILYAIGGAIDKD